MTTVNPLPGGDERRGTFRIEDVLHLEYYMLDAEEPRAALEHWQHQEAGFCQEMMRLRELSIQSNHALATLRKRHSDIAHYLTLLEKKVDILAQLAGRLGLGEKVAPTTRVNLSAGGLSFVQPLDLQQGERMLLKLVLFPSHICLQLIARVIYCSASNEGGYKTGVEFDEPGEVERETLIRHLLERQSQALRRDRELHE